MTAAALQESLTRLYPIPAEHRVADTDHAAAAQLLNCSPRTLDQLVHNGLPSTDGRFDSRDLYNLGLHSGAGTTGPEQAFGYTLRWLRAPTGTLIAPRSSTFELGARCGVPGGCAGSPYSVVARPLAKLYDGDVGDLELTGSMLVVESTVVSAQSEVAIATTLETRGRLAPLRAPALHAVMRDFLDAGLRWVKLPTALQSDRDLLAQHGIATCASAGLHLADACERAGYPAATRIGWVIGMLDLVHAWVEVVDDDGETKVLDPIFALFAAAVPDANPMLRDPTVSLRTNRLIPTGLRVGESVAGHACGWLPKPVRVSTKILPRRAR
ncbi:hypothetical protein [Actinophytocola sp.]|uniref:hypothetical protein n=1 Tax=Actinophytocola sp. TaxID=1872138 RepID=UPI0025BB5B53|nr:hypothetical protein [Actinophytocola sp.]